jgi:ATP synthase protein I
MADESMDSGPRGEDPLRDLDARLRAARDRDRGASAESAGGSSGPGGGLGLGLRIGVEMVSALGVGLAMGWGLDRWLGTKPWLMVVFFFLGAAAGILNVYRAATGMDDSVGFGAAQRRRRKTREQ